ncbi:MAG: MBL fold metallo-hydrolase [Gemmatimonadota bacterium]
MLFRQIYDEKLAQYAYLVGCEATGEALIIDPERDIDRYVALAEEEELRITAVAETHIHADFLSGAREFAERFGTKVYLSGEGGEEWTYGWIDGESRVGRPYDVTVLRDGDTFSVGNIEVRAVHSPGHTPEHLVYLIVDRGGGASDPMGVVSGDFIFVGDLGRPDLLEQAAGYEGVQEEAARQLYGSLPRFTELEDHVQVWPGHGAGSVCGKALGAVPTSTVGYEKRYNASLAAAQDGEDAFVDAILSGQPEPPLYFARMKRDNRDGVPLLDGLPRPRELTARELGRYSEDDGTVVIDTRLDRSAFMARHLPGSLYAPMTETFNTRVGSVLVDEEKPVALVIDSDRVEEAVRDLVRIGFDNVVGYATPETLVRYLNQGGPSARIEEIDFDDVARMREDEDVVVLDVRYRSEYDAGHVPGAVNASYTRLPELYEDRVPPEGTLLVHCSTGARSAVAAAWLEARGRDVKYVGSRWTTWSEGDHPVEKEMAEDTSAEAVAAV